jgi:hypothetical protein
VTVFVDLPAIRPARLCGVLAAADLTEHVRGFRTLLRGARVEAMVSGVRLVVQLDLRALARVADEVRATADTLPFFAFRVLAEPPECWLEVTGEGRAADLARAVFAELAA